jgi:hypothetical protein
MILHRTRDPTLGAHNMVANELRRQSQRLVPHVQLNIRNHPVLIQTNQLMVMPRQRVHRNAPEKPHFRYFQISVNSTGSHKNPRRTQLPDASSRSRKNPGPICARVVCYEPPVPATRCPIRYCSDKRRLTMQRVRDRERKCLWRNNLAGRMKFRQQEKRRQNRERTLLSDH